MLVDLTIKEFIDKTAGNDPVPGGGSISALNGAIATALAGMVANLTIGRKKYVEVESQMQEITEKLNVVRERLIEYIDKDSDAYDRVFAAFKLPKETEAEIAKRSQIIQEATKEAALIPMKVAEETAAVMDTILFVAKNGNQNAVTDACVAMMAARTGVLGALLNVRINLSSIKDESFVNEMKTKADQLESEVTAKEAELLTWIKDVI